MPAPRMIYTCSMVCPTCGKNILWSSALEKFHTKYNCITGCSKVAIGLGGCIGTKQFTRQ